MELLIWYLLVVVGFGFSVRGAFQSPKKITPRNYAREFMQQVTPYTEYQSWWSDSTFDLEQKHGTAKTH
jgi:hypothetical protein